MPNDHESTLTPSVLTQFLELDHFWRRGRVFTDAKKCFVPKLAKFDFHAFLWRLTVSEEKFSLMFQSSIHPAPRPSRSSKKQHQKKTVLGSILFCLSRGHYYNSRHSEVGNTGPVQQTTTFQSQTEKKNDTPCLLCNKKTFQG